ncbi:hypothetical protein BO82DRAFT_93407 [Aspergillus uvarum CBS 121591]|uniref:Uncharacterized protein n=1 Tax=Aspergillus uvarum CBS 121591 TaxID=1448315 RepID=A0A319CC24_9EURO|nr:hypothetical protein BO82DRAFT_93407 [Aspergillus uvarum CBS 121591]PYH81311.1 hypothetical protein BO82DRAFT_93407 [Aspergillus uvarum CBS 121591]
MVLAASSLLWGSGHTRQGGSVGLRGLSWHATPDACAVVLVATRITGRNVHMGSKEWDSSVRCEGCTRLHTSSQQLALLTVACITILESPSLAYIDPHWRQLFIPEASRRHRHRSIGLSGVFFHSLITRRKFKCVKQRIGQVSTGPVS